jgi:hypothetical protein
MSVRKNKYPEAVKRKAVELGYKDTNRIYQWKKLFSEKSKGRSIPSENIDANPELQRRLAELEMENEELKKALGEKSLIIDLLKKLPGNSLYEKNANGLTKTIKDLAVKKRHSK